MNTKLLVPVLVVGALFPAACKSTQGHDRAADTAEQVVEVGGTAGQTQLHLDKTLAALERVESTAKQDPKPAYDEFAREFAAFSDEFSDLTKEREALRSRAETWFAEFEKQNEAIHDEDLRKAGTKRLKEFRDQVSDLSKQVDELMTGTAALKTRLQDVRTFLGNDLTPGGIGTVSGRIRDGVKEGRKLAAGLGKLSKSSEDVADRMRAARQRTTG